MNLLRIMNPRVWGITPVLCAVAPGTPPGGKYALGWGELAVDWAPYPLYYHGGSNSMNLAHIWLDTKQDLAIVIATNISGSKANEALLALANEVYRKFMGK